MRSSRAKPVMSSRTPGRAKNSVDSSKDPVEVFCRLRPMQNSSDVSCMRIISDTTIVITPPESASNYRNNAAKEIQTTFTKVFSPEADQRRVFSTTALPLVEKLIQGENGLLFTYGVTGSGKTYTMTGEPKDSGVMPRCLDVLFNSIQDCQAKKFTFKPDRMNGFEVQSPENAMMDWQQQMNDKLMTPRNRKGFVKRQDSDSDSNPIIRDPEESQRLEIPVEQVDNLFAVFVTYIEIYNNSVYDLLDDEDPRSKTMQSKIIREDGKHNMYIHAVTELEVRNAQEAFEVFQRGQRKRRVAHTALNSESSRSHSVFTIRLVQAPSNLVGEEVFQSKDTVCISQLSLVDLAGSERTNRTKNTGQRLREAGNINNSLMMLRSCLEILRENQIQGTDKIVPYRGSKLTHLFKNYFDNNGVVKMVVCVNPRSDDYDETIQVMKFAEMTQEVQVARPVVSKLDLGYTPGRRQANRIFKEAKNRLEREGKVGADQLEIDIGLVYSLGGEFPDLNLNSPSNDQLIRTLMMFLEKRINKRNILRLDLKSKEEHFRKMLVAVEEENRRLKIDNDALNAANQTHKKAIDLLTEHVNKSETQNSSLFEKLNHANETIKALQQELRDRELALNMRMIDKQKVKQKYNTKIQQETDRIKTELEMKHRELEQKNQMKLKDNEKKIRLMKQILVDDSEPRINLRGKESTSDQGKMKEDFRSRRDQPVANLRHRRSQSADRWIDHRPGALVPVGTVLQPHMKTRRSLTKLTSPSQITDGASRYCLIAQDQDTDGELETRLYKGDIVPTSGGGAQVVFDDVECLKQVSPTGRRKRSKSNSECVRDVNVDTKRPRV